MKRLKNVFVVLFSLCMLFTLFPSSLLHAESDGTFKFKIYYHDPLIHEDAVRVSEYYYEDFPISIASPPRKEGMLFTGYNTEKDGTGTNYQAGDSFNPYQPHNARSAPSGINDDKTEIHLYSQFKKQESNTIRISYYYIDSDYSYKFISSISYDKDSEVTMPSRETLNFWTGKYKIAKWDTGDGFTEYEVGSSYPAKDITDSEISLYAIDEYESLNNIVYHNGPGQEKQVNSIDYEDCFLDYQEIGFTAPTNDSVFIGWTRTENDANGEIFLTGDTIINSLTASCGNTVHVYALWKTELPGNITFDANGGTGNVPNNILRNPNELAIAPFGEGLSKDGKSFYYWSTTKDGLGENYYPGEKIQMKGEDIKLYAIYSKTYSLTYELNCQNVKGITAPKDDNKYIKGSEAYIQYPKTRENDEYRFLGWSLRKTAQYPDYYNYDFDNNYYPNRSIISMYGNTTLYGVWEKKTEFQVKYDCSGYAVACPVDIQTYKVGDTIVLKDLPLDQTWTDSAGKTNFFTGWNVFRVKDSAGPPSPTDTFREIKPDNLLIKDGFFTVYINDYSWVEAGSSTKKIIYDENTTEEVTNMPSWNLLYFSSSYPENLSDHIPKREGYIFAGWSTKPEGTEPLMQPSDEIEESDFSGANCIQLYAIWNELDPSLGKTVDLKLKYGDETFTLQYPIDASVNNDVLTTDLLYLLYDGTRSKEELKYNLSKRSRFYGFYFSDEFGNSIFNYDNSYQIDVLYFINRQISISKTRISIMYQNSSNGTLLSDSLNQSFEETKGLKLTHTPPKPVADEGYKFAGWQLFPLYSPPHRSITSDSVVMPSGFLNQKNLFVSTTAELKEIRFLDNLFSYVPEGIAMYDHIIITPLFVPVTEATIEYYYDGKLDETKSEILKDQEVGTKIETYTDKAKENYVLDKVEGLPLKLVKDKGQNIIKVYYVHKKTEATIEYYYDGLLDEKKSEVLKDQEVGSKIETYTDKVKENYVLDKVEGLPLTLSDDKTQNIIKVYYVHKKTEATIEYYYDGKLDKTKSEVLKDQDIGTKIETYTNKVIENYVLDKVEGLPMILKENAADNIIRVYYVRKEVDKPIENITKPDEPKHTDGVDTSDSTNLSVWVFLGFGSILLVIMSAYKRFKLSRNK